MPRGRHRHSPPLHRLLPPSTIAGASLVCAAGAWLFTEPVVLRGLAGAAAAVAVVGSVVMRRWDRLAGKRVAELTRARKSDEWRYEERTAELESDLDESRELRLKLEQKLRAKRAELAALRTEHAALLRRYANAETERASALEGRRLLAIEAAAPARALPPADGPRGTGMEPVSAVPARTAAASPAPARTAAAPAAPAPASAESASSERASDEPPAGAGPESAESVAAASGPVAPSPDLFLRANSALDRLARGGGSAKAAPAEHTAPAQHATVTEHAAVTEPAAAGKSAAARESAAKESSTTGESDAPGEGESQGKALAAVEHARAAATPRGHYLVPTAAAVVPPAPVRRREVEGSFDFFGTGKSTTPAALEAVQNQDLADVVGEEVLALHKAEAEAEFKPAADNGRAVGQVIDLTEHDETEQIDVGDLRSALQA
ncbi:hypothetical protein [Streptomyces jeddahensis]|uniref:Secreted protein n=1 Tax=Streptomyces jeddahensis TaxID=1716141 RepID=A0A177HK96_9ACTN|nr:hypothetical protein [Streptomyces jeddahensis]OAH11411.1 hypothetical protein STSP_53610 [Streptomyces jeddahensis]